MTQFLQSNVSMVVAAVLAILLTGLRAASLDKAFRRDLTGAVVLLVSSLVLRLAGWLLPGSIPPGLSKGIDVAWMLAFAFGLIRGTVSLGLWLVRLRSAPTPKILRDVIDSTLYALSAVVIIKHELDIDLTGLLATSAILSVVIGLALQDTLGNLFAGLSIQLERPFQVGDYVTIKEHTGQVVQIAWRATRLETFRKEVITVPNSTVSKEAVTNFSRALQPVAIDLYIGLAYSAAPNRVREAVLDVLGQIPLVLRDPPPRCRAWAYDESSLRYQIRYFVSDLSHADNAKDEIFSRLWYRLHRDGIEIPYPHRTLHLRSDEPRPEISDQTLLELVRSVDLFTVIRDEELPRLCQALHPRRFGRGEKVIEEGKAGHTFYLVVSGSVSVRTNQGSVEVSKLGRGQYFGEMSLLTGEPRAATVVAETDALLLELDRPVFARLFEEYPNLARQLSALLAQRRTQLRAVAEAAGAASHEMPETNHIFARLRQIFALKHD